MPPAGRGLVPCTPCMGVMGSQDRSRQDTTADEVRRIMDPRLRRDDNEWDGTARQPVIRIRLTRLGKRARD
jgi:hypothetical protein